MYVNMYICSVGFKLAFNKNRFLCNKWKNLQAYMLLLNLGPTWQLGTAEYTNFFKACYSELLNDCAQCGKTGNFCTLYFQEVNVCFIF